MSRVVDSRLKSGKQEYSAPEQPDSTDLLSELDETGPGPGMFQDTPPLIPDKRNDQLFIGIACILRAWLFRRRFVSESRGETNCLGIESAARSQQRMASHGEAFKRRSRRAHIRKLAPLVCDLIQCNGISYRTTWTVELNGRFRHER